MTRNNFWFLVVEFCRSFFARKAGEMSRRKKYPKRRLKAVFKPTQSEYVIYEDPLNGVSLAKRIAVAKQISTAAEVDYIRNLEQLEELILDSQPKAALSVLSAEYLVKPNGISLEWQEKNPVLQHHVELIQSLALKYKREDFKRNFPDIDEMRRLSKLVCDQFWQKRRNDISLEQTEAERRKRGFEETTRTAVQVLRNWGYPQHVHAILTDLWKPLDDLYTQVWGVKPTRLLNMLFNLGAQCEDKLNEYQQSLHSVLKQKTVKAAVEVYKLKFPAPTDNRLDLLASAGLPLKQVLNELYGESTEWLSFLAHGCFKEDIIKAYGDDVEWDNLKKVLDLWSLKFGELAKTKTDFLFMGSPIREKPFISEIDDYYYLPLPNLLYSFTDVLLEQLHKGNEALKTAFDDWKGPFVEEDLHARLKKAFPRAEVYRGSKFVIGKEEFENDILVLVDNYAMIIEAKAASVTDSAKRAGNTVQRYVNELYITPAEQAERFQKYLETNRGILNFETKRGVVNTVDTTGIKHFLRLGVVLDDVSLNWKWEDLVNAGFISGTLAAIPIILLADFHVILDLLERTCDKIHYFERRMWLARRTSYEGDELDLLSFYLDTGMRFDFGDLPPDQIVRVEVMGRSQILEPYYTYQYANIAHEKPKPKITPWMETLLNRIEKLEQPLWLETGLLLLNMELDKQEILAEKIAQARKSVAKKNKPAHETISFTNNWMSPEELVIVHIHHGQDKSMLEAATNEFCQKKFESSQAERAVVLVFEPHQRDFSRVATLIYAGKRFADETSES